jgi:ribonuclease P protein component
VVNVSEVAPEDLPKASGGGGHARFPRRMRLLRRSDFQSVYKRGKRHFAAHLTLFYLPRTEGDAARFGFSVAKHLGGAVERNRIKRRLREAVRLHAPQLLAPVDVVINPKKSALNADFSELKHEMNLAFGIIEKSIQKPAYRNTD